MSLEIERKFLVNQAAIPAEHLAVPEIEIEQGYLGDRTRLRRQGNSYFQTQKSDSTNLVRQEIETTISAQEFQAAWSATEGRRLHKWRRTIHTQQPEEKELVVDRFVDELKGLWLVEVEFSSEQAALDFQPLSWFGDELTGYLSNEKLASGVRVEGLFSSNGRLPVDGVERELVERDKQDELTGMGIGKLLLAKGFTSHDDVPQITFDTGVISSIEARVHHVLAYIQEHQLALHMLTVSGQSGTGKSSTAQAIAQALHGGMLSSGQVFRYLTAKLVEDKNALPQDLLRAVHWQWEGDEIVLMVNGQPLPAGHQSLHSPVVEKVLASLSSELQSPIFTFIQEQVPLLNQQQPDRPIVLEGRAYNLRFLRADLRIFLSANPRVRAVRRFLQYSLS